MTMQVKHVDLKNGVVKYPVTKTVAFEMPISKFMIELLHNRIAANTKEFGADCRWVFPSVTAASGHLEEAKLIRSDAHAGYIHPDLDDLRASQQLMTDYLLAQIEPKPKGKKRSDNVVKFQQRVA